MLSGKLKGLLYLNTYGWIAIASLLVAIGSGILLAIPYDIAQPFISVANLIILNPSASFVRNLHFWSAQSFLIFSLLHVYDHLNKSNEDKISSRGVWLRLTLSLAVIGYVMISGFILKADADSLQARQILSSLLNEIPFAGPLLNATFIGPEKNWQLLYVQHIATATIILIIAVYDHVRTIWVNIKTFIVVLLILSGLSLVFRAPLTSLSDPLMKGPWYFVGLQDALHYVSHTWIIVGIPFLYLILIYFLPVVPREKRRWIKKTLVAMLFIYGLLTLEGFFFRGENWSWQWPWKKESTIRTAFSWSPVNWNNSGEKKAIPLFNGQPEACLSCHTGMKGLSLSHSESNAGCYSCHLGDPFTLNKELAHHNMVKVPGNLSNASRTCGNANCHPGIVSRVNSGMMASLNGMISVDRYVFHESTELDGTTTVHDLTNSAADTHLKNLCAGCHLGSEKVNPGPPDWLDRGGGCNACHLSYSIEALKSFKNIKISRIGTSGPAFHPAIDLAIGNEKCRSCHSRSGRISMNYEGWHETTLEKIPSEKQDKYTTLPDGRIFEKLTPDIHHQLGLSCIDCHCSTELMGDGKKHYHKEEAVKIQCQDCHLGNDPVISVKLQDADRETQLIAWLRNYSASKDILKTQNGGIPIVNSYYENGKVFMITKLTSQVLETRKQSPACSGSQAHKRLDCNACHTAWAPQCLGCHTTFESQTPGYDMLTRKQTSGSWVEYAGKYLAEPPTLGINEANGAPGKVQTFVPGMILSVDKSSFKKGDPPHFFRLFAPSSAHTTQRSSRSCISCHNDPLAIGYGRGELQFSGKGKWTFSPHYAKNPKDGLPEDAWLGFLTERQDKSATRNGCRPFNLKEQKRILTVGACLTCHDQSSDVMQKSLADFPSVIAKKTSKCIVPNWDN